MNSRSLIIPVLFALVTPACSDDIGKLTTSTSESPVANGGVDSTTSSESTEQVQASSGDRQDREFYDGPIAHQPSQDGRSWSEGVEVTYSYVSQGLRDWERKLSLEIAVHENFVRDLNLKVRYFLPESPDTPQLSEALRVEGGTRPGTSVFWSAGVDLPAAVVNPGARLELCGIRIEGLPFYETEGSVFECSDFIVGEMRDVASVWQPDKSYTKDPAFDIDREGGVTLTGGGIELTLSGVGVPDEEDTIDTSNDSYVMSTTVKTTNSVPTRLPSVSSIVFMESGRICQTFPPWAETTEISPGETVDAKLYISCERRRLPDPTQPGEYAFVDRPTPITEQALLIVGVRGLIESDLKLLISISN